MNMCLISTLLGSKMILRPLTCTKIGQETGHTLSKTFSVIKEKLAGKYAINQT